MNERQSYIFKTPLGRDCVIKTYLTAMELRQVETAVMRCSKMGLTETLDQKTGRTVSVPTIKEFDTVEAVNAADDELIRQSVISYNGSDGMIFDRIMNEKPAEHHGILEEVKKLLVTDPT